MMPIAAKAAAGTVEAGPRAPSARPILDQELSFDTAALDPRHRTEAYRTLYAAGADVEVLSADFHAALKVRRRRGLLLYRRTLSHLVHTRDAARVRRDGFDHFTLHLNLGGRLQVQAEDVVRTVGPGEIVFLDTTRPSRNLTHGEIATLSLPRTFVAERRAQATRLHGAVLPAWRATGLAQRMAAFWDAPQEASAAAVDALQEALDSAVRDMSLAARPDRSDWEAMHRDRIRSVIERGLDDPDQTPERVAAEVCLSRATLYRVFERLGTPTSWRQTRRLWRFRQVLACEAGPIADAAQAAGLSDPSYAAALFSRSLGMTPSRYRSELARVRSATDPEGALRWVMANVPVLLAVDVR